MLPFVKSVTKATDAVITEKIQELWSGYGEIVRVKLEGCELDSVVVKRVSPKSGKSIGHLRKVRSYQVEKLWYTAFASRCTDGCRVPKLLGAESSQDGVLLVLEDMDTSRSQGRRWILTKEDISACLDWLASFHALFLGAEPQGLWPVGTFWHLATRPDELEEMDDLKLKQAAPIIDSKLNNCQFKTIVHGDAKPANFCFGQKTNSVAAVDFQYVGGGCGIKDVVYLLSFVDGELSQSRSSWIDYYFSRLRHHFLTAESRESTSKKEAKKRLELIQEVEKEWRQLEAYAWADLKRFVDGWGGWANDNVMMKITEKLLKDLDQVKSSK